MELGGNKIVNSIYEAKDVSSVKPNATADLATREKYIRSKYVSRTFFYAGNYDAVGKEDNLPTEIATNTTLISPKSGGVPIECSNIFSPVNWDAVPLQQVTSLAEKMKPIKEQLSVSLHSRSRVKRGELSVSRHSQSVSGETSRQVEKRQSGSTYQTALKDDPSCVRRVASRTRTQRSSSRSRSRSSSGARKASKRLLKPTSTHSSTNGNDDSDGSQEASSFAANPDDSSEERGQNTIQTGKELCHSFRSISSNDSDEAKNSSKSLKAIRRMPRGGRGLDRAISVPNLKPRSTSQTRRRDERKTFPKEGPVEILKESMSTSSNPKSSGLSSTVELQEQRLCNHTSSSQLRLRSHSQTGGLERRRRTSSVGSRRRPTTRSRSGEHPRRRGVPTTGTTTKPLNHADSLPFDGPCEDTDLHKESSNDRRARTLPRTLTRSRSERVSRNPRSRRSKLSVNELFPSDQQEELSEKSVPKPEIITEVRKKLIEKESWLDGDFSDEDLFDGNAEKLDPRKKGVFSQSMKLSKDCDHSSGSPYPPHSSYDIAAVTFYT